MQWEFFYIQVNTNDMEGAKGLATRLGALGWEPVGIASADKTLGLNSNVLTFKRPITDPLPPAATDAEWQPDPSGRNEQRRWIRRGWTADVMNRGKIGIDPPTMYVDKKLGE